MATTMSIVIEVRKWLPGAEKSNWKEWEVIFLGDRNILDLNLGSVYTSIYNFKTHQNIHLIVVYFTVYKLSQQEKKN